MKVLVVFYSMYGHIYRLAEGNGCRARMSWPQHVSRGNMSQR